MERERKSRKVLLIILLLALVGLSIGFAAFTSKLTIQSSAAVEPSPDAFKVVFSSSATASVAGSPVLDGKYATGGAFEKDATTISNLKATFTEPGQVATWKLYAFNSGEYEAFLNKITLGTITCTAKDGTDETKVAEAEKGIKIKVTVNGEEYTQSNDAINSHSLAKGTGEEVLISLEYAAGSAIADGDFDIAIGDITLEYNSVD